MSQEHQAGVERYEHGTAPMPHQYAISNILLVSTPAFTAPELRASMSLAFRAQRLVLVVVLGEWVHTVYHKPYNTT